MIGIFDSGIGGMTVAQAIEQLLPEVPLIYLGDLARTPYGPKSAKTISEYSVENTRFLVDQGAQLIIIACNSAASVATERLRQEFDIPILEVITPAVNAVMKTSRSGRIGVIGTRATTKSGIYQQKIQILNPAFKVFQIACPLLVPLIEEGWTNRKETKMILRGYLRPLKDQQIDTLVLGCTHYPLLKNLIGPRVGRRFNIVDSSRAMAEHLKDYLEQHSLQSGHASHTPRMNRYCVNDTTDTAVKRAEKIFGRSIDLHLI